MNKQTNSFEIHMFWEWRQKEQFTESIFQSFESDPLLMSRLWRHSRNVVQRANTIFQLFSYRHEKNALHIEIEFQLFRSTINWWKFLRVENYQKSQANRYKREHITFLNRMWAFNAKFAYLLFSNRFSIACRYSVQDYYDNRYVNAYLYTCTTQNAFKWSKKYRHLFQIVCVILCHACKLYIVYIV